MQADDQAQPSKDAATLLAAASMGFATRGTGSSRSELDDLKATLGGSSLLARRVINQVTPKLVDWVFRPWSALRLRAFQQKLAAEEGAGRAGKISAADLQQAFRAAMRVRYGVPVDHAVFRDLRGLVLDGLVSEQQLKFLLSCPTVLCGRSIHHSAHDGPVRQGMRRLWALGRPPCGQLAFIRFHLVTRVMLWLMVVATFLALACVAYVAVGTLLVVGPGGEAASHFLLASHLAIICAGLLWVGPCADRAASFLTTQLSRSRGGG